VYDDAMLDISMKKKTISTVRINCNKYN